jgi:hypothetical protein
VHPWQYPAVGLILNLFCSYGLTNGYKLRVKNIHGREQKQYIIEIRFDRFSPINAFVKNNFEPQIAIHSLNAFRSEKTQVSKI